MSLKGIKDFDVCFPLSLYSCEDIKGSERASGASETKSTLKEALRAFTRLVMTSVLIIEITSYLYHNIDAGVFKRI